LDGDRAKSVESISIPYNLTANVIRLVRLQQSEFLLRAIDPVNRLVVGSIATASTAPTLILSSLTMESLARREPQPVRIVVHDANYRALVGHTLVTPPAPVKLHPQDGCRDADEHSRTDRVRCCGRYYRLVLGLTVMRVTVSQIRKTNKRAHMIRLSLKKKILCFISCSE
jgi:hypothetical protein